MWRSSGPDILEKYLAAGREEMEAAFWARVDKSAGDSGCWPWKLKGNRRGYGQWTHGGRPFIYTHRLAFCLTHNVIPGSALVMHSCDNPPCCNPAHLSLGTHRANTMDMVARGRHARAGKSGERNNAAKLTQAQAEEIRRRRHAGELSAALAAEFGVHKSTVKYIANGKTWSDGQRLEIPAYQGAANQQSKLNVAAVHRIRKAAAAGEPRRSALLRLAAELGVSLATVYDVWEGKTWKHVS